MSDDPVRLASVGMVRWSDVLADAIQRTPKFYIVSCGTRSVEKRGAFARKYGCRAAGNYEEILACASVEGIINATPNHVQLETAQAAAQAGADRRDRAGH